MIKIEDNEHAFDRRQLIAIVGGTLHRGFPEKTGIVQMEIRLSDFDSEGESLFIAVFDETLDKKGDYTPLDFDKEELSKLIKFLSDCYEQLELRSYQHRTNH